MTPFAECDHADRITVPPELGGTIVFDEETEEPVAPGTVQVCRSCGVIAAEFDAPRKPGRAGIRFHLPADAVAALATLSSADGRSAPTPPTGPYRQLLLDALDTPEFRDYFRQKALDAARAYFGDKANAAR